MSDDDALSALVGRLAAAYSAILATSAEPIPSRYTAPESQASYLFGALVSRLKATPSESEAWLVLTALSAAIPSEDDLLEFLRRLELDGSAKTSGWLLQSALDRAPTSGMPLAGLDIVSGGVLINVDFVAQHDLHTGIQRVVRETVSRWNRLHDIVLCAWSTTGAALRGLSPTEQARAAYWDLEAPPLEDHSHRLVIPWKSTLLLPEPLPHSTTSTMRSLARFSGNQVVMIGYDAIPVTSAESLPNSSTESFSNYLSALKYATLVVGISASASEEFLGFGEMLGAQGLPAPLVRECLLPVDGPAQVDPGPVAATQQPMVLCVGSLAPHKNHLALLHAAEILWREGLDFQLLLVGASGWNNEEFHDRIEALTQAGRSVTVARKIGDDELWELYRQARFTVFPSLHEGFGLPVAESLAFGTPVVTTSYGSTAEIAEGGGVILVDPRDDHALASAMRTLLVDDALLAALSTEAAARPPRRWDDYADDLWTLITEAAA